MEIEAFLVGLQRGEGREGKEACNVAPLRGAARRNFILAPIIWHGPLQGRRAEDIHSERERERAAGRTMKGQLTSLCDAQA